MRPAVSVVCDMLGMQHPLVLSTTRGHACHHRIGGAAFCRRSPQAHQQFLVRQVCLVMGRPCDKQVVRRVVQKRKMVGSAVLDIVLQRPGVVVLTAPVATTAASARFAARSSVVRARRLSIIHGWPVR